MIAPSPASFPVSEPLKWIWIPLTWTVSSCQYGAVIWTTGIPLSAALDNATLKFLAPLFIASDLNPHSQSATNVLSSVYPVVSLSLTYSV